MIKQLDANEKSVVELSERCFDELRQVYRPTELAVSNKNNAKSEWSCFGFHVDQVLIGIVEARQVGSELQLSSLAVAPSFRQKGVARKLVDFVVTQFKCIDSVSVWCVDQTGNVAVFKALGFNVVQRFDSDFFILSDGSKAVEVQLKQKVTA
ncbi:GNAT family N-acetyltransferase [Vibrio vulnificus]|uniref:GNAT family N-acetyltransferase n=1 Tax=Vibrio vulnificus TaxID=672 RepID=UPI0003122069|nr:GNAT family N-acetyltransferase [Vibrio vulnificus]EJE1252867.1 GNAT family N-acetyltransferase [Vibrio parahaemolyticus]EHH1187557.1 GNAT family N-acetyltransferase [Vibrio vulnificus]EHK9005529.1 GNAT family N-acetyltransferase [Vibrio vulnificus]EHT4877641.1 GNAT family N-acetyltransferase [Vibrio vulnificus]EHU4868808.1 GNAT family N-acetyltransferase [Vibrio vulnificus]